MMRYKRLRAIKLAKFWKLGQFVVLLLLFVGCRETPVPPAPTLIAAPTIERRLVGLVDEGQRLDSLTLFDNPGLVWQFETGDGQPLLDAVASGELDAALVHHLPLSAETLYHTPVALDGLVLVVHPDNPINDLTLGQIQAIYSGQLTYWHELGGVDAPIELLVRGKGSGVRELLQERVMGSQRVSINAEIRPNTALLQATIAENRNAIGLTTYSSLTEIVQAVAINGIAPHPTQFATQQYPLMTPLYWVSQSEPTGELRGLLAYLQSEAGQVALGVWFGRIR